jgi:hypothetical protein
MQVLVDKLEAASKSWIWKTFFANRFFSFSVLRSETEFRIIQTIFENHYYVPLDFSFASYLSGCFACYYRKIINRSILTWLLLTIVLILNYARMTKDYYYCIESSVESVSNSTLTNDESIHRFLRFNYGSRFLSSGTVESTVSNCNIRTIRYYLVAGFMLCAYFLVLLFISRVYRLRYGLIVAI